MNYDRSSRRRSLDTRARCIATLCVSSALLLVSACGDTPLPTAAPESSRLLLSTSSSATVLVGFQATPGDAEAHLITTAGGQVIHRYRYIPVFAASVPLDKLDLLRADPRVAYVEGDIQMVPLWQSAPSKGKQVMDWGVFRVQAPQAWALGHSGQGVKVGIFDSGIDIDHPDLDVVGGIDLVGDGNGLDDCQGHGTHVAGIVAAKNNGNHTVGVAPRAQLYSMRFADCNWAGATLVKMIQGIEWAIDNGMQVVNMSFGFGINAVVAGVPSPIPPGATSVPPSFAAEQAFAAAHAAGVVLIGASGNGASGAPTYAATPWISYPAAYSTVIAVGATDDDDMIAQFSQYGTDQDVTAPGVQNLSSWLVGLGQMTTLTVVSDNNAELGPIAMLFSANTGRTGMTSAAVYAALGTVVNFAGVDCAGKIAVVSRGGTSFAEKAVEAMNAGCAALIIHNHTPGNFAGTLGTERAPDGRPWIPVVSIALDEGLYLRDRISAGPTTLTLFNGPGNVRVASGTSMAAPNAAGVAALILSKNPNLSAEQVRAILRNSADDLGTPGWDPVFGAGRVNALRAVQLTP